jgi:hypothetical protein
MPQRMHERGLDVVASMAARAAFVLADDAARAHRALTRRIGLLMSVCTVNDLDHLSRKRRPLPVEAGMNHLNPVIPGHPIGWNAGRPLVHEEAVPIGS